MLVLVLRLVLGLVLMLVLVLVLVLPKGKDSSQGELGGSEMRSECFAGDCWSHV